MTFPVRARPIPQERTGSLLTDVFILTAVIAVFYGVLMIGRTWFRPFNPVTNISTDPWALPVYSAYSLLRIAVAYFVSLVFSIGYGYAAVYSAKAERILVSVLDVLQSIPVLSFLPGVMLAMVALFPHTQLGVELGVILLIFTGQVWNIAFSFYSSLKCVPRDLREVTRIYGWGWWQRFMQLDLPYASIGLVWNSMMSVAGGWFFLMVCEMFVLGKEDFRLPGLGSYLQLAASSGEYACCPLGADCDDRRNCFVGPARLAPSDHLGGEIQIRAGRGCDYFTLHGFNSLAPFCRNQWHTEVCHRSSRRPRRPVFCAPAKQEAGFEDAKQAELEKNDGHCNHCDRTFRNRVWLFFEPQRRWQDSQGPQLKEY